MMRGSGGLERVMWYLLVPVSHATEYKRSGMDFYLAQISKLDREV